MSYCRFGDNSDLYMYHHISGFITCCMCRLAPRKSITLEPGSPMHKQLCDDTEMMQYLNNLDPKKPYTYEVIQDNEFKTRSEAIAHLKKHMSVKHNAPYERVIGRLKREIKNIGDEVK